MTIIGQLIGQPNFDSLGAFSLYQNGSYTFHLATAQELAANPDGFVMPGTIVTTIINFLLIAVAVYFAIVMPMNKVKERLAKEKARGGRQEGHRHRAPHRDPRPALRQAAGLINSTRSAHALACTLSSADLGPAPGRDRFISASRSVALRSEIGRNPHRDRSTSGSRSVRVRAILGNRAARRPLRITTAGLPSRCRGPSPGQEPASLMPSPFIAIAPPHRATDMQADIRRLIHVYPWEAARQYRRNRL